MIIEIGTCDFETKAGEEDGIFIEPVSYYFNRLPDCNKENVAISDYEGETDIFFLKEEDILKYRLPFWIRGCNSIKRIHPTVDWLLRHLNLPLDLVQKETVRTTRIKSIIDKYKVEKIDCLKTDTEGHDCIIINDFLDTVPILPEKIIFEANVLISISNAGDTAERLRNIGYSVTKRNNHDYVAILEKINKTRI